MNPNSPWASEALEDTQEAEFTGFSPVNTKETEKDREVRTGQGGDREEDRAKEKQGENSKKRSREADINGPPPPGLGSGI